MMSKAQVYYYLNQPQDQLVSCWEGSLITQGRWDCPEAMETLKAHRHAVFADLRVLIAYIT